MTVPTCPDCHHPVDKHYEFYCEQVGCLCNNSRKTAMALYERELYKYLYEETLSTIQNLIKRQDGEEGAVLSSRLGSEA